jgi:hypothetical protein
VSCGVRRRTKYRVQSTKRKGLRNRGVEETLADDEELVNLLAEAIAADGRESNASLRNLRRIVVRTAADPYALWPQ